MKNNDNQQKRTNALTPRISAVALVATATLLLPTVSQASTILPLIASLKVPEPSLLLMLGTGVSGLGLLRWRFKRK